MRHKWQPRSQALPSCGEKKYTGFSRHENIEYWNYYWNLSYICLCLCSFCCKGILEFSTLYFIYFAPSAHLTQSWNLFQTLNFNTAHFRIQYCTLFIQYCTKCAILHTKIVPESLTVCFFVQYSLFLCILRIRKAVDIRSS
jgi:hypothetical protein